MGARRYARPTVARAIVSCRSQVERPSKSGEMTAMSMSLDSLAVPLAKEPYKTTASRRIRARSLRTKSSSLRSSSTWLVTTRRTSSSPRRALVPLLHYTWRRDSGSSPHGPRASLETSYASPSVQHQPDPPVLPGRGSLAAPFPAPPYSFQQLLSSLLAKVRRARPEAVSQEAGHASDVMLRYPQPFCGIFSHDRILSDRRSAGQTNDS